MVTNFQFLKKINKNLFEIISEAEKLYRDEYFEQCMTQTRRFGEQICKEMLIQNNRQTGSFDDMLATLKDNSNGSVQEKEFIDDLYFLKKNGNLSVHSSRVNKDGMAALECLKRSFEVAINYSVYNQGASSNILKLNYDVELLVTEKKSKPTLKERYEEEKSKQKVISTEKINKDNYEKNTKKTKQKKKTTIELSLFWKFIFILSSISLLIICFFIVALIIHSKP